MRSVMIVDDEPTTRQGIVSLIPWEDYGYKVVGSAGSGFEALEKYDSLSPNIMIVDMKMPGMSGIELIEKIHEINHSVVFLILSGHAEFEYAKRAMKCNVKGYLLKPVDEDELIYHLIELKKELDKQHQYVEIQMKWLEEKKEQLIMDGLKGSHSPKLEYFLKEELNWYSYKILVVNSEREHYDMYQLKHRFIEFFEKNHAGVVVTINSALCILLHAEHSWAKQEELLFNRLNKIDGCSSIAFRAAISKSFDDMWELSHMYDTVCGLLKKQFFYKEGLLLNEHTEPILKPDYDCEKEWFDLSSGVDKLLLAMEVGDKSTMNRILLEFLQQMINMGKSEGNIKQSFIQMLSSLLNKLMYEYQDIRETISNALTKVFEIEKQTNISNLLAYVSSLLNEIIKKMDVRDSTVLVKKMIHLIENNYDKNLKLETLAEVLNYNRSYLGKLFKSSTGVPFNTYLDKVRIENAKKLLLQGLKVYQVAERIGFSNVDYFHSKFRKYVGVSPSKYRNEYQVEH